MVTISFLGSSKPDFAEKYEKDIEIFIESLFKIYTKVRIITGGYLGIMEMVCKIAKEKAQKSKVNLEIIGVVYSGYKNDKPNSYNNRIIMCHTLNERVQTIIELSDLFVALPGENGTCHEIYSILQEIRYPSHLLERKKNVYFVLHDFWKNKVKDEDLTFFKAVQSEIDKILINIKIDVLDTELIIENFSYEKDSIEENIKSLSCEIEKLISGTENFQDNILALDIAYSYLDVVSNKVHAKNYSYSCYKYKKILKLFLEQYNSLLGCNVQMQKCKELNNNLGDQKEEKEEIKSDQIILNPDKKYSTFDNWCQILTENNLGKLSIWLNKKIKVEGKSINLSSFLVLDTILPPTFINKIFDLLEKFLLWHLSLLTEIYLRTLGLSSIDTQKYKIKNIAKRDDKDLRDLEKRFLVVKHEITLLNVSTSVINKIFKYSDKKTYDDIKRGIVKEINELKYQKENKEVFQDIININDITNYKHFIYGRMLFLIYHLVFDITLQDAYGLLLKKKTVGFDRTRFQRQFSIKGIKKDKISDGSKDPVTRLDQIVPHLSDAEYNLLSLVFNELKMTTELEDLKNSRNS